MRCSRNLPLQKSSKNSDKSYVIDFHRSLEINRKLVTIPGRFRRKTGCSTINLLFSLAFRFYYPVYFSVLHAQFENYQSCNALKCIEMPWNATPHKSLESEAELPVQITISRKNDFFQTPVFILRACLCLIWHCWLRAGNTILKTCTRKKNQELLFWFTAIFNRDTSWS